MRHDQLKPWCQTFYMTPPIILYHITTSTVWLKDIIIY